MRRWSSVLVLMLPLLATAASADPASGPTHPAQLPALAPGVSYPRCTPADLAAAGYPDPFHAFLYPGYEPRRDADGATYGPRSLARGTAVLERDGLDIAPGRIAWRGVELTFAAGYEAHHMLPMVEMLDWARLDLAALLGHDRPETLRVVNPDNLDEYLAMTGHHFHRLYRLDGGDAIIEPAPVLFARGLAAHAAHQLVARWLLDDLAGEADLPAWLRHGLVYYLAEEGTEFLNYLAMYRPQQVIMPPAEAAAMLDGPPLADKEQDKVAYRTAGYAVFLMVWELAENRGGLDKVIDLVRRSGQGDDPDAVSRQLWGVGLADLAAQLDPLTRPEPVGGAVMPRQVQKPPSG
jgi:hypothetical protein